MEQIMSRVNSPSVEAFEHDAESIQSSSEGLSQMLTYS